MQENGAEKEKNGQNQMYFFPYNFRERGRATPGKTVDFLPGPGQETGSRDETEKGNDIKKKRTCLRGVSGAE